MIDVAACAEGDLNHVEGVLNDVKSVLKHVEGVGILWLLLVSLVCGCWREFF